MLKFKFNLYFAHKSVILFELFKFFEMYGDSDKLYMSLKYYFKDPCQIFVIILDFDFHKNR